MSKEVVWLLEILTIQPCEHINASSTYPLSQYSFLVIVWPGEGFLFFFRNNNQITKPWCPRHSQTHWYVLQRLSSQVNLHRSHCRRLGRRVSNSGLSLFLFGPVTHLPLPPCPLQALNTLSFSLTHNDISQIHPHRRFLWPCFLWCTWPWLVVCSTTSSTP